MTRRQMHLGRWWYLLRARHVDTFNVRAGPKQDNATMAIPDVVAVPPADLSACSVENTSEPNQREDIAHLVTDPA